MQIKSAHKSTKSFYGKEEERGAGEIYASRHRMTTTNPPVEVDSGGQPRSRGSKRKGSDRAMEEQEARKGGGNPSARTLIARLGASPAHAQIIAAKHRDILHRVGSSTREDGGVRDRRGQRYETEQRKDMGKTTKHGAGTRPPR